MAKPGFSNRDFKVFPISSCLDFGAIFTNHLFLYRQIQKNYGHALPVAQCGYHDYGWYDDMADNRILSTDTDKTRK